LAHTALSCDTPVTESGFQSSEPADGAENRSPFQGLGFYTESDAKWFFGRATERKIILAHLRTARLTLLYAESGVGKSSLLRAGVAARLRELAAGTGRSPKFVPLVFSSWKDDPVEDLISQLVSLVPASNGGSTTHHSPDSGLAGAIDQAASTLDATLVIILDQFEEHFSYRLSETQPDRLADELAQCVNSPRVRANFLIAVREDAYGKLGDLFSGRIANVYNNYLHLEYLSRDAARDAIEKPVEIYNAEHAAAEAITLDPELAGAVLDEVRRGNLELGGRRTDRESNGKPVGPTTDEIETPFLQLVMTRLWEWERSHQSTVLRRSTLDGELGGAEAIVRNHVDRALGGLTGPELDTATDIFHDLVTPSGVKVAHTADDLAKMTSHSHGTVASVLNSLYEQRIVRAVDPAPGTMQPRYEIFHDRLAVPILEWRDQQQNARLERAKQSAELEARTQRKQARRFKRRARIMLGLVVCLLVVLAALVVSVLYVRNERSVANQEKRDATYLGLTTRAESQLASRPDVSLLLYLEAYRESPQPVAERNLVATLQSVKSSAAVGILHGHTDAVEGIAFSPSGTTLASASGDKTIRLWKVTKAAHGPLGPPLRYHGPLYSVAFAPSGQMLASGTYNDVIVWSIPRHAEQEAIPFPGGAVNSVAYSPNGTLLAAGGSDGEVLLVDPSRQSRTMLKAAPRGHQVRSVDFSRNGDELAATTLGGVVLWDLATHAKPRTLIGSSGQEMYSVAFSPDGKRLAFAGSNGAIYLWNLTGASQPRIMRSGSPINSIAFSPNGRTLVAGGAAAVTLWNVATGRQSGPPLAGQLAAVYSVAFNPRGTVLAAAGADRTISLWKYPIGARFGVPIVTRTDAVESVAFSPSGLVVAAGDADGNVVLTNRSGQELREIAGNDGQVRDLAFEPAGNVLAAAYADGVIRLWDPRTGRELGMPLRGHQGPVFSIDFNRAGTELVSGGWDGTVRLWNLKSHTELGNPMQGDLGAIYSVAFSPDGREIAAGGSNRAIGLWSAQTHTPLAPPLIAQDDAVFSVAFSPDGHLLASGGADDTIHIWNIKARPYVSVHTLTGDANYIRSVAFSPDGATLASASTDNSVRLWDVKTGTELGGPLEGDTGSVESIAFSPHGRYIVSGSKDGTVRLWQSIELPRSFPALRNEVCSFLGAGLSTAEWSQYAPKIPYDQHICPLSTPS
jgi:WD40 repeat protein